MMILLVSQIFTNLVTVFMHLLLRIYATQWIFG